MPGSDAVKPAGPPALTTPTATEGLLMAVGVLGVSTSGPLIAATAAPALAIAFWRNAMATVAILPFAAARHWRNFVAVTAHQLRLSAIAGLLLAGHFAAWVTSLTMTSVATSTALVCLQAGWAAVFSWLAGERLSRRVWVGLAIGLAGAIAVSGVDLTISTEALVGDLLALLGGVLSGAYVVLGARVRRTTSTTVYTSLCYGTCSAALLAGCLLWDQPLAGYELDDWAKLVALTVAAQLLGHSVFNRLLATVSPTLVALVILVEVPGAAILAALFLGQVPPPAVFPGLVLVLVGAAVVVVSPRGREPTAYDEPPPIA